MKRHSFSDLLLVALLICLPVSGFSENLQDREWQNPDWNNPSSAQSTGIEGSYLPQNYENPNNFPAGTSSDKAMNNPTGTAGYGPPPSPHQSFDSDYGPP